MYDADYNKHISVQELTIYPNPTTDEATISFPEDLLGDEKVEIEIFNHLGQLVKTTQSYSVNNISLQLGGLATGSYYVYIRAGSISFPTQKLTIIK